jgi:hypothetical protein
MVLHNIGILPHHHMVSQPENGGSKVLWNAGILPHHYTASQPEVETTKSSATLAFYITTWHHILKMEVAWPSKTLVPYHITTQHHKLKIVAAWSSELMVSYNITTCVTNWRWRQQSPPNISILHHYRALQPEDGCGNVLWYIGYPTTSLHGITTQRWR